MDRRMRALALRMSRNSDIEILGLWQEWHLKERSIVSRVLKTSSAGGSDGEAPRWQPCGGRVKRSITRKVSQDRLEDSKISSMERGLRDLEEEIQMLKSNGALSTEEREEEMRQMEVYRSHSKFTKNKVMIGQVKQELSRKDTELLALQTKLETLTNQFSDSKQHTEVLKESLTAKEPRGLPSCRTRWMLCGCVWKRRKPC
ncbi:ELKS/Rab6-interacting/CAST family member 1-like [Balaenoptera acutorostrata]|uniref:ELKS/Rab6-interacting/CAST family member 1-like n=1 Tax=Balaenoptera acutorostrata TaxID=9767 RepID=A0ABM3T2R7_BALAC|nr:ELKS/Rab6-interacting/CAST family member 1-like [Balaenoptera acutorostrata]